MRVAAERRAESAPPGVGADVVADERDPEPDVGLGQAVAEEVAPAREPRVELGERLQQLGSGLLRVRPGAGGRVHALVDRRAEPAVELLDLVAPGRPDRCRRRVRPGGELRWPGRCRWS